MADAQTRGKQVVETATSETATEATTNGEIGRAETQQADVDWNYANMTTNFANVVNIQSSPEQLDICFGTNHTLNLTGERRVSVELTNRIIMSSPLAAKRMHDALARVIEQHELRYGKLAAV